MIELELFNTHLLSALYKAGHHYFVRQTLPAKYCGNDKKLKACFLITHYNEYRQVDIHLRNISDDANKYVYNMEKDDDRQKLYVAALQPEGYKIYTPLTLKKTDPMLRLKKQFKAFIDKQLGWTPKKSDDVSATLTYGFGIFYIEFKWKSRIAKVKADEVAAFL